MLFIDDDMLKLAKMQERLLRVTDSNRDSNLDNYKKTIGQIDSEAFASLLEEVEHLDEHNQSLEEELQFLKGIKSGYDQLNELQLGFIDVCQVYGSGDIKLSDLSQLNIDYVNNRINVIEGYLLNLKNIEVNKQKIQELSEQLVDEEKKKDRLSSKLEQLEQELKNSFLSAEGRRLKDGSLEYTSVINEYKNLGIDFTAVLDDPEIFKRILFDINRERNEVEEKFRAAEICYNNFPNAESKQILDEIRVDLLKVKYRWTMIKMIEELSTTNVNYDLFREKREKLLDLIKYRLSCLESLGVKFSIDPFSRTKIRGQLDVLMSLTDNSKIINRIRKEISQLTDRTEEMVNQNSNYLISLADAKELLISKVGISDIDISEVELPHSDVVETASPETKKIVDDNQVINIRTTGQLNMSIVEQKTSAVIKRVNQMMNDISLHISNDDKVEVNTSPELVIVPSQRQKEERTFVDEDTIEYEDIFADFDPYEVTLLDDNEESQVNDSLTMNDSKLDLFETVIPFEEPVIFQEKSDDSLESEVENTEEIPQGQVMVSLDTPFVDIEPEQIQEDNVDVMPDAFWITEENNDSKKEVFESDEPLSFDDQIDILLAEQQDVKARKLVDDKNIRKAA